MAKKILITEDDEYNRMIFSSILVRNGYDVITAEDGQQGINAALKEHPDLILMDVQMPVMTGFEAVKQLKAHADTRDIPVIIVSTEGSKTRIENLMKMGAIFIRKPFTPEIIRDAVNQSLHTGESHE